MVIYQSFIILKLALTNVLVAKPQKPLATYARDLREDPHQIVSATKATMITEFLLAHNVKLNASPAKFRLTTVLHAKAIVLRLLRVTVLQGSSRTGILIAIVINCLTIT